MGQARRKRLALAGIVGGQEVGGVPLVQGAVAKYAFEVGAESDAGLHRLWLRWVERETARGGAGCTFEAFITLTFRAGVAAMLSDLGTVPEAVPLIATPAQAAKEGIRL